MPKELPQLELNWDKMGELVTPGTPICFDPKNERIVAYKTAQVNATAFKISCLEVIKKYLGAINIGPWYGYPSCAIFCCGIKIDGLCDTKQEMKVEFDFMICIVGKFCPSIYRVESFDILPITRKDFLEAANYGQDSSR